MTYILAVSGGVDSVALLDMFTKKLNPDNIVVAHFDHGIRGQESKSDALFVEKLSQKYRVKCEIGHGNLTKDASEDEARQKRYEFLRATAANHKGSIMTAHHQDDLIETIAINLTRGTGWRGLAVFGDTTISRPLLNVRKSELYAYALTHNLEWVEDETNQTDAYLRNRLRRRVNMLLSQHDREKLLALYRQQIQLKDEVRREIAMIPDEKSESRYFLTMMPEVAAVELLRHLTGGKLTRPQLERVLLAIKTYSHGSTYQAGAGIVFAFTKRRFIVTNTSGVI